MGWSYFTVHALLHMIAALLTLLLLSSNAAASANKTWIQDIIEACVR